MFENITVGQIVAAIISLGAVIGAIGVIKAFVCRPIKEIRDNMAEAKHNGIVMEEVKADVAELKVMFEEDEFRRECYLIALKQAVYNGQLPDSERLRAFKLYEKLGGNGYTKEYVEVVLRPRMHNKIVAKAERNGDNR